MIKETNPAGPYSYKTIDEILAGHRVRPSLKLLKPTKETFRGRHLVMNELATPSLVPNAVLLRIFLFLGRLRS